MVALALRPTLAQLPRRTKAILIGAVVLLHVVAIGLVLRREPKTVTLPPIEVFASVVAGAAEPSGWVPFPVVLPPAPDVPVDVPDFRGR